MCTRGDAGADRDAMNFFLADLMSRHEVSPGYLDSLVPTVEVIFEDIPAPRRGPLLVLVEEAVLRHAETSAVLDQAQTMLEHLRLSNAGRVDTHPTAGSRRRRPSRGTVWRPSIADRLLAPTGS